MTPPAGLSRAVEHYLSVADRLVPGLVTGCYVVGSAALGDWRPDMSDIDVVAVVGRPAGERELRRLSLLHKLGNLRATGRALARRRPHLPGTVNAVFVAAGDLGEPVTRIRPVASHSGPRFRRGQGFDVNPVMWKVLRERGIAVRGPAPATLGLDPEPSLLRSWTLDQLRGHWARYAARALSGRPPRRRLLSPYRLALGYALSPPRLHRTVTTGEVISKEAAGAYALDTFDARWHPLLQLALAHRRGVPGPALDPSQVPRLTGEFIHEVIATLPDAGAEPT
ncbi:nucleotidyltransferase domain-containing protein [Nonomuraea wenchangensis]